MQEEAFSDRVDYFWWIAVVLSIAGRIMEAIGMLVQKYAHVQDEEKYEQNFGYWSNTLWLLGFAIFVTGHCLCWFAMALGSQIILSGLLCISTATTILLAPMFLGETVTRFRLISVILMIAGCVWVILAGPKMYFVYTVDTLKSQVLNHAFLMICCACVLLLLIFFVRAFLRNSKPLMTAFEYTIISSMLGWYSVLAAKAVSGLFFTSVHFKRNQFIMWETWVMVLVLIVLAFLNFHFLNQALKDGDAVFVIPVYESISIVGQVVVGGIFFEEFAHLSTWGHINVWAAITCICIGVILVSGPNPKNEFLQTPVLSPTHHSPAFSPRSSENGFPT